MKIGVNLSGSLVSEDGAKFAAQAGAEEVVLHLTQYTRHADKTEFHRGAIGPIMGDCNGIALWSEDVIRSVVNMLGEHGLECRTIENFSPNFWSDILLDGPEKEKQLEGIKQLLRNAGRAGITRFGYNFSVAGVWGWQRRPEGRGGSYTAVFDMATFDHSEPMPDGMVWNMRYREAVPGAAGPTVTEAELWERLEWFLTRILPVAADEGVMLCAHPDDPPAAELRGCARLVNSPEKYDRLIGIDDNPANGLEFCLGSLQEMPGANVYDLTRRFVRAGRVGYIHFRNVRGKVPHYREVFLDEGDLDMAEIVRILRDEGYDGLLIPDHTPEIHCAAPWQAGMAYALGYMRALIGQMHNLGPASLAD